MYLYFKPVQFSRGMAIDFQKLLLQLRTRKTPLIFYTIMQAEHTTLCIQHVKIETIQGHCLTIITSAIDPALIPMGLVIHFSGLFQ